MSDMDAILEELAISYEQLSLFYDWNEQFSTISGSAGRLRAMLERIALASSSDAGIMLTLGRGQSASIVASHCNSFHLQEATIDLFKKQISSIESKLLSDFTINLELQPESGTVHMIVIPWRNESDLVGAFVFTRKTAPYSHQDNVLLGNTCVELGIMYQNKSLMDSIKERNRDIATILTNSITSLSSMLSGAKNTWGIQANYSTIRSSLEETYVNHLFSLARILNSMHPLLQKRTENMRVICNIIAETLGYDDQKNKDLETCAILSDVSILSLGGDDLVRYLSAGTLNLDAHSMDIVKHHPETSGALLEPVEKLKDLSYVISCHHERWDGQGYPKGLKGDFIPEMSAIIYLAYSIAYKSQNHYKSVLDLMEEPDTQRWLIKQSGKMFNPVLVKALFKGVGFPVPPELEKA